MRIFIAGYGYSRTEAPSLLQVEGYDLGLHMLPLFLEHTTIRARAANT